MLITILLLLFIAAALNWLSKKLLFYRLSYERAFSKKTVEFGEDFEFVITVENKKMLPVTFLQIFEQFPDEFICTLPDGSREPLNALYGGSTMLLLPMQRVTRAYKLRGVRGQYELRKYLLSGGDLLGFGTVARQVEEPVELIVLPKAAELSREIMQVGDFYGDYSVRRWIIDDPVLTIGVREYTGGEPFKTIHWPSSLKSGSLMVKKFDYTTDNTVLILLNTECGAQEDKIERCLSIARSVAEELEKLGTPYGLATNAGLGGKFDEQSCASTGVGESHLGLVLECLGRVNYTLRQSFEDFLTAQVDSLRGFTSLIVITPTVFEQYVSPLCEISRIADRTMVISLGSERLEELGDGIAVFTERGGVA